MKNELDQFYTNPHESDNFVEQSKDVFKSLGYKNIKWLEPSAGSGNFLNSLKKVYKEIEYKAFDLEPKNINFNIEEKDYLEVTKRNLKGFDRDKLIVIGNPPFGKRAKLAIDFFNHSCKFSDTIAMIFPLQFRKWSVQSNLNDSYKLIEDLDVPKGSFLVGGAEYDVNTCFQIWTKRETKMSDLRIKEKPKITHDDFEAFIHNNTSTTMKFFDKDEYGWEFAVHRQGYYDYGQIVEDESFIRQHSNRQWIFIKPRNKTISKRLRKIDYERLSKMNTTIPGFGKADLIKEYIDKYDK